MNTVCVVVSISVGGLHLLPQLKSTKRETATQQHPTPVPPGDMEQKETQPDERTPTERKGVQIVIMVVSKNE